MKYLEIRRESILFTEEGRARPISDLFQRLPVRNGKFETPSLGEVKLSLVGTKSCGAIIIACDKIAGNEMRRLVRVGRSIGSESEYVDGSSRSYRFAVVHKE